MVVAVLKMSHVFFDRDSHLISDGNEKIFANPIPRVSVTGTAF